MPDREHSDRTMTSDASASHPPGGDFFIVGVGASAGGLEALEKMFAAMPDNTGMAFVIVQHLSPNFKSLMHELLARHTQMPIHLSRIKPDILWGPRHHLPVYTPGNIKAVLTIHDTVHRLFPQSMPVMNLISERFNMALSVRRADCLVTVSKSTASDLNRLYPHTKGKTHVVPSGTPPIPNANGISGNGEPACNLPENYLLFVGTLEPRKNLFRLLQAFEEISRIDESLHLVCVGAKGWRNSAVEHLLRNHPAKLRIVFTGYVDRARLAGIYKGAQCLVFASLYEGFGFPILEAMSMGVPVITANVSSMPEVAGKAALCVNPEDSQALAGAVKRVLYDNALRLQLIRDGKQRARQFSWTQCARHMCRLFEQVVPA